MNNQKSKKTILVSAYLKLNLGDDLFLKVLFERYPNTNFKLVDCPNEYIDIFRDYQNVEVLVSKKRTFLRRIINLLMRNNISFSFFKKEIIRNYKKEYSNQVVDGFIRIGGSIFIQRKIEKFYPDVEFFKYWIKSKTVAPLFFLGCNFGPYLDDNYFNEYKNIFAKAKDVCFRDKYSASLFKDLSNVRVAPDIVLSYNVQTTNKLPNSVGLSLINPNNRGYSPATIENYSKNIIKLITDLHSRDIAVYLFSFCSYEEDDIFIESLVNQIKGKKTTPVYYNGNIPEFLGIYSQMQHMFCGRFHSIILSILFKQSFIPITYSEKMNNYLDDIQFKGNRFPISEIHIDNLYLVLNNEMNTVSNNLLHSLRTDSSLQFSILDRYL